jgi:hypothetical protein
MKLYGRHPGSGGVTRKSMPPAAGNKIPPRTQTGGGLDDTGGDVVARQLTRLSVDERPPHSSMSATRNMDDVFQPGVRRDVAENSPPLGARMVTSRLSKGLRGGRRVAKR